MKIIFLFLFLTFYFLLAQRKLFWALILIIAFLPSYLIRFQLGFLPTTLLEMMILILFFNWLMKNRFILKEKIKNWLNQRKIWFFLIFFWLVAATLAMFNSPNLRAAAGLWKAYFIEPILLLIVFLDLVKNKKEIKIVLGALTFSAFYLSIYAIYQKIFGLGVASLENWPDVFVKRVTSVFPFANALGLYLGPVVFLILGQLRENWLESKKPVGKFFVQGFLFLVLFFSFLAIIFARSEGALLGLTFALIFFLIFNWRFRLARIFLFILLFLILYLLFLSPQSDLIFKKITFQDFSGHIRLQMWQETWQMLKNQPFFGAGLAGYQTAIQPYHQLKHIEIYLYPHNIFLNFWSELGLLGLIVFILIVFQFFNFGFKKLFRDWKLKIGNLIDLKNDKTILAAIMASMISLIVHGLVDVPYFKNDLSVLFWLIVGLLMVNNSDKIKKAQNSH